LAAWPTAGPLLLPAIGEGDGGETPAKEGGMFAISTQLHDFNETSITTRLIHKSPTQNESVEKNRLNRIHRSLIRETD
jgi:hypothetical protein